MNLKIINIIIIAVGIIISVFSSYWYYNQSKDVQYRYTFQTTYDGVSDLYELEKMKSNLAIKADKYLRLCPFEFPTLEMTIEYSDLILFDKQLLNNIISNDIDKNDGCTTFNFIVATNKDLKEKLTSLFSSEDFKHLIAGKSHFKLDLSKINTFLVDFNIKTISIPVLIFNSISILIFLPIFIFVAYFALYKIINLLYKLIKK